MVEALASEQTSARAMVADIDHDEVGSVPMVGIPFQMFGTPPSIRRPPPVLGQHSHEVLVGELGLEENAFAALLGAGLTTTPDS